jgi:diaminohydroxyphosphoribosylaminopyrimidine deaminase/5-amino-6-(5-phosphoribosylamino)uracil reductase
MNSETTDLTFMARAIALAKKGRFTTTPNPNVGCIVVKDGTIIGEGWHQRAGTGHAEVNALAGLSVDSSRGATAYVTLEPCSHYGRTPPCAMRLIEAQVSRVVVAMLDPNPLVAGKGIAMLEQAGIDVTTGVMEADARALNPGFLSRMERDRPFIQVKLASSLDGKTALENGASKWITAKAARRDVQTFRALSCAILTSAKTVIVDNAKLNVREDALNFEYPKRQFDGQVRQPTVVVLDGNNRITKNKSKELDLFASGSRVILVKSRQSDCFDDENTECIVMDYEESGFAMDAVVELC